MGTYLPNGFYGYYHWSQIIVFVINDIFYNVKLKL